MSHHKKPVKASVPESQLFISHGFFSNRDLAFFPPLGQKKNDIPSLPSRTILYHPFTSQINLLLSDNLKNDVSSKSKELDCPTLQKNTDLVKVVSDLGTYQYFSNFNLADLLDVSFAQAYLRLGSLVAMSVSRVMGDDVFAIDGHGTIHMRLNQSTYQTLGLPGRRSKFGPPGQHFVVEIDIRDRAMQTGKPNYERTRKCLDNFPSSMLGDLLGPKYEFKKGRRWDVVMSWVDEQGNLQPIQISTNTAVKTCVPEINETEKIIPYISKPDITSCSVEALLDLHELVGEVYLATEFAGERSVAQRGVRTSALTIEATGLFHPFKLAELVQTLVKSHSIISITAHTAQFSPFSFLINRMTKSPRMSSIVGPNERGQKKKKKGKSVMIGPERGVDAGPTSWTFIAFEDINDDHDVTKAKNSTIESSYQPDQSFTSTDSIPTSHKRIKLDKNHNDNLISSDSKVAPSSCLSKECSWLIFESVGHHDSHC